MRIGITGATGFVGTHVAAVARNAGHVLIGYSRKPRPVSGFVEMRPWLPPDKADFSGLDAVIHLAGESVFGWWSARKRDAIRRSRVDDTLAMLRAMSAQPGPPPVVVSAGGVALYGDAGDNELTEASPPGTGFLAEVARAWEDAALEAGSFARAVSLRIGLVLGRDGGAVPVLRRVFRLGLGGRLGSGRQWAPWIHVTDLARLFVHAVECPALRGPVNAVAPGAVRNAEFTKAVARACRRPAVLPVPRWALRCLPGGMSDLFLHSQRVIPAAARESGFSWLYPELAGAVEDAFAV